MERTLPLISAAAGGGWGKEDQQAERVSSSNPSSRITSTAAQPSNSTCNLHLRLHLLHLHHT